MIKRSLGESLILFGFPSETGKSQKSAIFGPEERNQRFKSNPIRQKGFSAVSIQRFDMQLVWC